MTKRLVKGMVVAVALGALLGTLAYTADQTILGKSFSVKDPEPGVDVTKRKVSAVGREFSSPNTVIGDPTVDGATVEIIANGTSPSSQIFTLPAAGWKRAPAKLTDPLQGYTYKDPNPGLLGPVKSAVIKQPSSPTKPFSLKVSIKGANGPGPQPHITVLPPNLGTDGAVIFTLGTGDRYCMTFGGTSGGKV